MKPARDQSVADRFVVITGGPGSGKSTLIAALAEAGFDTAPETGRKIIKAQVASGGRALPWADRALYAEAMLARDIASYQERIATAGPVFFDRGIPDVIGYLTLIGLPVPAHLCEAATRYRYHRRVFIAPPWPEIFTRDAERKQTLDEAERTYAAMLTTYADCDYDLIEIPRLPVPTRAAFVLAQCGLERFSFSHARTTGSGQGPARL